MLGKKSFDYDRCILYTTKFIILMTEKGALYYTPMCIIHKLIW